jgi:lactate dehydrogenase-like 2-hydroxyacid dehydrogenase
VHELTLIEEPLNGANTNKAEGCKAVVSFPTDDISREVVDQLSEMNMSYIVSVVPQIGGWGS